MFLKSHSGRIFGLGVLVSLGVLMAAALLLMTTNRTRSAFLWVNQNEGVIRTVDEMIGDIREAESGQRGFLLTRLPNFLDSFNERIESAERRASELTRMVRDDTDQLRRVGQLRSVLGLKIGALRAPLQAAAKGDFTQATAIVASGHGRALMDDAARRADEIKSAEQGLLRLRMDEAEGQAGWNHDILLYGGPLAALVFFGLVFMLVRGFRRPLSQLLHAINALGAGQLDIRAPTRVGVEELDRLAFAYNGMADQLTAAIEQQAAADTELRSRGRAIELLGGMAHRMQAARSDTELADVLRCFLPRVLPDAPGALYVHNKARNQLCRAAEWGEAQAAPATFAPDACWALRRGQSHFVATDGEDVRCSHVDAMISYHCEPVLAGGEVVGLLYLEGQISSDDRFRLAALTENVALALVNQRLQHGLREQSIRDPLTNLFNRRYLEETLAIEVARARRSKRPLGVLMCDVDHFKRFNDEHGHEAGDVVLKAVAKMIETQFRDGDIVCRYGGEEFAVLAPTADLALLVQRAETLIQAIRTMPVRYRGQSLGPVTMSVGLAGWSETIDADGTETLRRADVALYCAKQAGRDRVAISDTEDKSLMSSGAEARRAA